MPDLGVYIHFPWCRKLCPYCDFPVAVVAGEPPHEAYADAVLADLAHHGPRFAGRLRSIYFGGGTPALWAPSALARVIERVRAQFDAMGATLEVTLECNPTDCTAARLASWRAHGITRVSVGVQSFDPEALVTLGRDHRLGDSGAALSAVADAGLTSWSADLIFAIPTRAGRAIVAPEADDLARMVAAGAPHVSAYELTIEPGAAFAKRVADGRLQPRDDEAAAAAFELVHARLVAAGYEHYEVSSFARPGQRAIHNSLYWAGADYLGLGVGAHSALRLADGGVIRSALEANVKRYLATSAADRQAQHEQIAPGPAARDRLWLGLRTHDGVPLVELRRLAGVEPWLLEQGLIEHDGDRARPTLRGFLFANQIAARIDGALNAADRLH